MRYHSVYCFGTADDGGRVPQWRAEYHLEGESQYDSCCGYGWGESGRMITTCICICTCLVSCLAYPEEIERSGGVQSS